MTGEHEAAQEAHSPTREAEQKGKQQRVHHSSSSSSGKGMYQTVFPQEQRIVL